MIKKTAGIHYNDPVFFDLETSGLDPEKNEIIQMAFFHPRTKDSLEVKVKFDVSLSDQKSLSVNSYDKDLWLKEAVPLKEAIRLAGKWIKKHRSVTKVSKKGKDYDVAVLAGWNVSGFDSKFIIKAFKDCETFAPFDFRFYDFYSLAMFAVPYCSSYRLSEMAELFGVKCPAWHDALQDTIATAKVSAAVLAEAFPDEDDDRFPSWANDLLTELEEEADDFEGDIPF